LVYTLLQPAIAICRRFAMPLDVIEQLCRLAYYDALRQEGMTQAEVARAFGKSLRTVVAVGRVFQSDFLAPVEEIRLNRRLEEELATGPLTAAEVAVRLEQDDEEQVQRLLDSLVGAGRAERVGNSEPAAYTLQERLQSLVRDDVNARLDGLRHQLEVVRRAVKARFLPNGDGPSPSVARTLSFVGTEEDVAKMAEQLVRTMRLHAIDVEEAALEKGGYQRFGVTLAVAPLDQPDIPGGGKKR
jgi:hypothetical protein